MDNYLNECFKTWKKVTEESTGATIVLMVLPFSIVTMTAMAVLSK